MSDPAGRLSTDNEDELLFGDVAWGRPMSEKVDDGVVGPEEGPPKGEGSEDVRRVPCPGGKSDELPTGVCGDRIVK